MGGVISRLHGDLAGVGAPAGNSEVDPADAGDMRTAAFLSAYAYSEKPPAGFGYSSRAGAGWDWRRARAGLGDWKLVTNRRTDAQAVCAFERATGTCWVAFRGTESRMDLYADVNVAKARVSCSAGGDVHVHAGFLRQFLSVRRHIFDYVARHPSRSRTVVTGHSLGAALSIISAFFIGARFGCAPAPVKCIAFGCPRAGDGKLRRRMKALGIDVARVVHGRDPVARVPHRSRWVHCGRCVLAAPEDGGAFRCTARPAVMDDGIWNVLVLPNPLRLADHDMQSYVDIAVHVHRAFTGPS